MVVGRLAKVGAISSDLTFFFSFPVVIEHENENENERERERNDGWDEMEWDGIGLGLGLTRGESTRRLSTLEWIMACKAEYEYERGM